jgi:hypothetical protein
MVILITVVADNKKSVIETFFPSLQDLGMFVQGPAINKWSDRDSGSALTQAMSPVPRHYPGQFIRNGFSLLPFA